MAAVVTEVAMAAVMRDGRGGGGGRQWRRRWWRMVAAMAAMVVEMVHSMSESRAPQSITALTLYT